MNEFVEMLYTGYTTMQECDSDETSTAIQNLDDYLVKLVKTGKLDLVTADDIKSHALSIGNSYLHDGFCSGVRICLKGIK